MVLVIEERPLELLPHYFFLVTNATEEEEDGLDLVQRYRQRGATEKDYGEWTNALEAESDACLSHPLPTFPGKGERGAQGLPKAALGRQARAGLYQLKLEFTSDRMRRLQQRIKLYPIVLRVQELIDLRAAGVHPPGHLTLRYALAVHLLLKEPSENAFLSDPLHFIANTGLLKEAIERAADPWPVHCSTSFCRARAMSSSFFGIAFGCGAHWGGA